MLVTTTNGHIASFTLEGLPQTIRKSATFAEGDLANEAGAPVIAPLLGLPDVVSITLRPATGNVDEIIVNLKEGLSWDDTPPAAGKTRLQLVSGVLQKRLYMEKIPLLTEAGQRYFNPDFVGEIQAALDDMAEKKIIKTDEHNKGKRSIHVIDYNPAEKSLTLNFTGVCTTGCVGSRMGTEALITGHLCNGFPGAFSRPRIKYLDKEIA